MKTTVLVTGGAGFIGSHICKTLLELNYHVILLDIFRKSKHKKTKERNILEIKTHPELSIIDGGYGDSQQLTKIFRSQVVSYVIHLASKASVTDSIQDPTGAVKANLIGSTSLFKEAAQYRVKHIVYASSALVYGKKASLPMTEDDPCLYPTSPYAVSMRAVELMGQVFYHLYHIPITGLRFFPVIGPKMRQDLFLPVVVRSILEEKPIKIYGSGKTTRTYTHVDDIIAGIISSIILPQGCQIINLGGIKPISLLDLIHLVEKNLKTKAKIIFISPRKEEIPHLYPSIEKAKDKLGYFPKVNIEDAVEEYIVWWRECEMNNHL